MDPQLKAQCRLTINVAALTGSSDGFAKKSLDTPQSVKAFTKKVRRIVDQGTTKEAILVDVYITPTTDTSDAAFTPVEGQVLFEDGVASTDLEDGREIRGVFGPYDEFGNIDHWEIEV